MIYQSLEFTVRQLNDYFKVVLDPKPVKDLAVLSILADQNGQVGSTEENALIVSVVNIQDEKKAGSKSPGRESRYPISLILSVLVSAYFPSNLTNEALKFIGLTIRFFYANPVFTPETSPGLGPGVHKISWKIDNQDFSSISNLWSSLGAKLMPSVLYQVRLQLDPPSATQIQPPYIQERDHQSHVQ